MSKNILKASCFITGDEFAQVSKESLKSQDKVTTYGLIILMVMILWFLNGFLLSHVILNYSIPISLVVSFLSMMIVYVVETSIIKMSKINLLTKIVRFSLAFLIAAIGSISVDEVIFKSDISVQLLKDNQNEVLNSPITNDINKQLNELKSKSVIIESNIQDMNSQMIAESKTGYGLKTKLIERQLIDLKNQRDLNNTNIATLNQNISNSNSNLLKGTENGIIKNVMALIHYNNENLAGWVLWSFFFLLFLIIEALCIIIKSSNNLTSYEVKKENQDSLSTSQYLHFVDSKKDPIREGLRLLHATI
jgi:cell division protein FtsB